MVEALHTGHESNDCYDRLRVDLKKLNCFTDDFIDDVIARARKDDSLYEKWADYAASELDKMDS
jgi:hypothetical protein